MKNGIRSTAIRFRAQPRTRILRQIEKLQKSLQAAASKV